MKESKSNIKTNLVYGLIVLVPVIFALVILVKFVEILELVAKAIGLHTNFGATIAVFLALVVLLVLCYAAGALVRTQIGAWSFGRFEEKVLLKIPGYRILSNILKGFAAEKVESYKPALVQLGPPGTAVIGFVMDENDNDTITVFVPSVPALTVGALHIVERSRVTLLEVNHLDIVNCITEWGMDSSKIVGKTVMQKQVGNS